MLPIDHCLCRLTSNGPVALHQTSPTLRFHQRNTVKVSILAASRQLYEESNLLIWHTNTFSFDDPSAFTIFLKSLSTQQKNNIRNLEIRPLISQDSYPGQLGVYRNGNRAVSIQDWDLGDSRDRLIHRLHGVRSLRLNIKYVCGREPSLLQLEAVLSHLQILRMMPLEYATVKFSIVPYSDSRKPLDLAIMRLAAMFQRILLDTSGRQKVKEVGILMKGWRLHSLSPTDIFSSQ